MPQVKEYTHEELDEIIKAAEACGIVIDERANMPKGPGTWPKVKSTDRIGQVIHQNGSANFKRFKDTAAYHTGPNHITPAGMATTVYDIMIPDDGLPARITADFLDRKYAHADGKKPGDENKHLLAILVMGGYRAPGYTGYAETPSPHQMVQLEVVTNWLQWVFGYGNEGLFGHYNFGKAACPGYWGMAWLDAKRLDCPSLDGAEAWQKALLMWNPDALPKYGADGDWGSESKHWLGKFQDSVNIKRTAFQDDITELFLMRAIGWPDMIESAEEAPND